MGQDSELKSPKNEEEPVQDSLIAEFFESNSVGDLLDFKSISGITDSGNQGEGVMSCSTYDEINWDHLIEWDEFSINDDDQDSGVCDQHVSQKGEGNTNMVNVVGNVKNEFCGVWEQEELQDQEDDKIACLNLSLNFQKVMDAWSNRGPCWTDEFTHYSTSNEYMGEVPVMDEARTKREASVLKYKEKRTNRMFSRKIRYQVRKLNADKRPRLKGRFVKRES